MATTRDKTELKRHYDYYLMLERDLEQCAQYVDFSNVENWKVNSLRFQQIITSSCAAIERLAKSIYIESTTYKNFCANNPDVETQKKHLWQLKRKDLLPTVKATLPELKGFKVIMTRQSCSGKESLDPWDVSEKLWAFGWDDYNALKHGEAGFLKATLEAALNTLAALLAITLHHYKFFSDKHLISTNNDLDAPRLFQIDNDTLFQPVTDSGRF